jgi:hypothetical protein
MGSCLSPIGSKIYVEHLEKLALESIEHSRCGSGTLMTQLWSGRMAQSGCRISSATSIVQRPSIQFTMEIESDSAIHFLDVLFSMKGTTLATKICRKPTHTCRHLNFKSNYVPHVKRGLSHSLQSRASTVSQERQDLFNPIWAPLISSEVANSQRRSDSSWVYIWF